MTNKTMQEINKLVKNNGLSFDEAVEVVVNSRPQPKDEAIVISRPDYTAGHEHCICHRRY